MKHIDRVDPGALLHLMVEGHLPYNSRRAHDAAIKLAGGPLHSLWLSVQLVEFAFQLEATDLAVKMGQPEALVRMFRHNARQVLDVLDPRVATR